MDAQASSDGETFYNGNDHGTNENEKRFVLRLDGWAWYNVEAYDFAKW